jgi:hypothetical protein
MSNGKEKQQQPQPETAKDATQPFGSTMDFAIIRHLSTRYL